MRKLVLLTCAFILFSASAQAAELMKIGVYNLSKVVFECDAYKDEMKKMEAKYGKERTAIEKAQQDLEKKFEDLRTKQSALSQDARDERIRELNRQRRDLEERKNDFMRKVSVDENRMGSSITRVALLGASEFGKKNNYSLIIDANAAGAVHVVPALDITDAVLKEANHVYKTNHPALKENAPLEVGAGINRK